MLSTASGLVFAGDGDGNILAFDSRSGKNLWHYQLGFSMRATAGTTYMLDGRQYLLVPAGSMLTAFTLPADRAVVWEGPTAAVSRVPPPPEPITGDRLSLASTPP